jgi:hypothetical protein
LNGANGLAINGVDADDWSGCSVSGAGDFNGDGFDDIIIGARYGDVALNGNPTGVADAGEAYVVFGKAVFSTSSIELGGLDGTTGIILQGISAGDSFGVSVSGAGDMNGDGYDDIVVGAFWSDLGGVNSGSSYVIFGKAIFASSKMSMSTLNGANGFVLRGIDAHDGSGYCVSDAGDVNGDGFADIIISAPYADPNAAESGESYVVFGNSSFSAVLPLATLNGDNGFMLKGIDQSGFSVDGGGDFNGDGFDDVVIGAFSGDPFGMVEAGETYVVYGDSRCKPGEYTLAGSPLCFPVDAGNHS